MILEVQRLKKITSKRIKNKWNSSLKYIFTLQTYYLIKFKKTQTYISTCFNGHQSNDVITNDVATRKYFCINGIKL